MNDLIIIGAGPGGYEMALAARKADLKTILIEKADLGGTCLNSGCIPTKAYYKNAEYLNSLKKAKTFGVELTQYQFDFLHAKARKDNIVSLLKDGIATSLKKAGVEVVYGEASLVDKNTVKVNSETYQAKYIVIATGSRSIAIPNFENAIDSTALLNLETLPEKLVIIGGGVIGVEFAAIFNAMGVQVVVVEMMDRIIPNLDREISKRLLAYLKAQGITFYLDSQALNYANNIVSIRTKKGDVDIECDQVLVSVGRRPNLENLGLEEVGIAFDRRGIKVDENFKTNINNIYAIGDVNGRNMLAHYATFSGYHALKDILGVKSKINFALTPACVFTIPEVAVVGLTEEQCEEQGLAYVVKKALFRANGKAQTIDETDGYVKVIIVNDRIVGVHIIGPEASILIHEMVVLMNKDITTTEFHDIIHAHPTLSEIFITI